MTLIADQHKIKYGNAILIRSELNVKDVSIWEQDNVELISIEINGVVVHSVYKREVCTTSTRIRKPTSYCDRRFHHPQQYNGI